MFIISTKKGLSVSMSGENSYLSCSAQKPNNQNPGQKIEKAELNRE
jgi:hypothetical protein